MLYLSNQTPFKEWSGRSPVIAAPLSFILMSSLALLILCIPSLVRAQQPCGSITGPVDNFSESSPIRTVQIENCDAPFGDVSEEPSPFALYINDVQVARGGSLEVVEEGTKQYQVQSVRRVDGSRHAFYRQEGNDLIFVAEWPIILDEEDYRNFATSFFTDSSEAEMYLDYLYGDMSFTEDPNFSYDRLNEFSFYAENQAYTLQPTLTPGTYMLLSEEIILIITSQADNFPARLLNWFIPTVHAQYVPNPLYTMTFTLTPAAPEPTGASSVLFLPGIQASRLYKEGVFGTEDQIWPPNSLFNNDVSALSMNEAGVSDNNIYTRDAIDSSPGVGDVYKSFLEYLNELQFREVIENWSSFAYDWRYSVSDIAEDGTAYKEGVRSAIEEIEYLASSSYSGKVTIIGHSNGGLLAKAIMNELENQGKTNLVDTVVFLASPQLGTPKAVATVLHGYDQTDKLGGFIIDGKVVREVINNMPGVYGLLPSEKYFEGLTDPLITFTESTTTEPYRNIYGNSLDTYNQFVNFLRGDDNLDRSLETEESVPAQVNDSMLDEAMAMHNDKLDNWTAPDGVRVVEVVGTGLPTVRSIEYREIQEDKCTSAGPAGIICVTESEMKPYAVLTQYGDGTVVQRSAEGYDGDKLKYFVNLNALNIEREGDGLSSIFHHNVTESAELQSLMTDILMATTSENGEFISSIHTEFNNEYGVEMIDSPVRLLATDTAGNQTGVVLVDGVKTVKEDIPGSQYFEFGGTKYLVVPKDTDRTTRLYGEDYGGYTLTTATLTGGDAQVIHTQLKNASTTPQLVAEYSNINGVYSSIVTDINGDGVTDYVTTMNGNSVAQEITYALLVQYIKDTTLNRLREAALIVLVQKAEFYSKKAAAKPTYAKLEDIFLTSTSELAKLYVRKGYLNEAEGLKLLDAIEVLNNKQ